jgi:hypothetical protein
MWKEEACPNFEILGICPERLMELTQICQNHESQRRESNPGHSQRRESNPGHVYHKADMLPSHPQYSRTVFLNRRALVL